MGTSRHDLLWLPFEPIFKQQVTSDHSDLDGEESLKA